MGEHTDEEAGVIYRAKMTEGRLEFSHPIDAPSSDVHNNRDPFASPPGRIRHLHLFPMPLHQGRLWLVNDQKGDI